MQQLQINPVACLCWLQVHDEVILEGPRECVEEAEGIVRHCMMHPFNGKGLPPTKDDQGKDMPGVELVVDSKHADTWFEAK